MQRKIVADIAPVAHAFERRGAPAEGADKPVAGQHRRAPARYQLDPVERPRLPGHLAHHIVAGRPLVARQGRDLEGSLAKVRYARYRGKKGLGHGQIFPSFHTKR